jgi:hypothetical protein
VEDDVYAMARRFSEMPFQLTMLRVKSKGDPGRDWRYEFESRFFAGVESWTKPNVFGL